jgi:hypothetical protein
MQTLHVKATSKKALNAQLLSGETVTGIEYRPDGSTIFNLNTCRLGTVIKIYDTIVGGQPFVKSYGELVLKNKKLHVR